LGYQASSGFYPTNGFQTGSSNIAIGYFARSGTNNASVSNNIYIGSNTVILTWGPPAELFSNQGLEFVAELNRELSRQWGIKRQYAMAYHPQTNRQVERFNRTLKTMIAKFVNGRQDNWDVYLPAFL